MPIAEALAEKGHQVTVFSPFVLKSSYSPAVAANLRDVALRDVTKEFKLDWFQMQKDGPLANVMLQVELFSIAGIMGYDALMENEVFRKMYRDREIDLVLLDCIGNEFAYQIFDGLNIPIVIYSPTSAIPFTVEAMGIPTEYASVPAGIIDVDSDMTFFQRLGNMLSSELSKALRKWYVLPKLERHMRKDFPEARPIAQIEREVSLCLMNHHETTAFPRPLPPNVQALGGLHVRPAKPLPQVHLIYLFQGVGN